MNDGLPFYQRGLKLKTIDRDKALRLRVLILKRLGPRFRFLRLDDIRFFEHAYPIEVGSDDYRFMTIVVFPFVGHVKHETRVHFVRSVLHTGDDAAYRALATLIGKGIEGVHDIEAGLIAK